MKKTKLRDVVRFRDDLLFDGAVDLEWLIKDKEKATLAAKSFVFHGPAYHGVTQKDVGTEHGHQLIDSATFTLNIIRRCNGAEDQPFTLAIAGYGTGKSHLALTLATLLTDPSGSTAKVILSNIEMVDSSIGQNVSQALKVLRGKALVISLNGIGNFDLASEFTRQIIFQLQSFGVDTKALDELRPRFKMAANLVQFMSEEEASGLASQCGMVSKSDLVTKLTQHDEAIYAKTYEYFSGKGITIKAIGDETVKDVLETVCRVYCGEDKPFRHVLVLFDEFGQYAEFATIRSQVAGSGVLQSLFEGIQSNSAKATFVGFIQFDLNTYVQRIPSEYRNAILRVSTRYQSADKAYLSINLETLIANLLEKKNTDALSQQFDLEQSRIESKYISEQLCSWFPRAKNHHLWTDITQFHQIIRKGCWPLSPYASWFLFHLAAEGQNLQQRSALALLGEAFRKNQDQELDNLNWEMSAVDLWSDALQSELLTAEESGSLGTITLSYANIMTRNGDSFSKNERRLLQAIVLGSKMGLIATDRDSAISALSALSGVPIFDTGKSISKLENEYNVISWDQSFKQFEILGDSVSRPVFINFLRQRANLYNEHKKSQLFVRRAEEWGSEVLVDPSCDFAENHRITTTEWRFEHVITNLEGLPQQLVLASQNWDLAYSVDKARGTIVYCYLEPSCDLEKTTIDVSKLLRDVSREFKEKALPILVVFLADEEGLLGRYLTELDILDQLNEQEKARFGNLIGSHRQKCSELFVSEIEAQIKKRYYASAFQEQLESNRLGQICVSIFERIYPKVLSFPFDGFSTARGNAADSCMALTSELLNGTLDFQTASGKPPKEKNRALEVLKNTWKIFNTDGQVSRRPAYDVARAIISEWEGQLKEKDGQLNLGTALKSVCKPPFGTNIASAGLLLGVFIRARKNDFAVIFDGQATDFTKLIGDGIFRAKALDLTKIELVILTPASAQNESEWNTLLDEWERAAGVSYKELMEFWQRAINLKTRLPLPSSHSYRYDNLAFRAKDAAGKIREVESKIDGALERIEYGTNTNDLRIWTYGGAQLKDLQDKMKNDPMFDSDSITNYNKNIENVRQLTIQDFDRWLGLQSPSGATTKDASEYERKMIVEVGKNLTKLGLDNLFEKLQQHVAKVVRNINNIAEAHELSNKIAFWILENEVTRLIRIAELRNQRDIARDFIQKVNTMNKKVPLPEMDITKDRLSVFIENLKIREHEINERFEKILNRRFRVESLDELIQEVTDLEPVYEGCDKDLSDLRLMRRALHFYSDAMKQLSSDTLNESEYESLAKTLTEKCKSEFGSSDEIPWPSEKTMPTIIKYLSEARESKGRIWIEEIEPLVESINSLGIEEANNLFNKLSNPPAVITVMQRKKIALLYGKIERRLNELKIEWLVVQYNQLEEFSRKKFLQQIGIVKQ